MDDIMIAKNEAIHDANMENRNMYDSLDEVRDHFVADLENEATLLIEVIDRALVDRKHPCKVLLALRIDWLKVIDCPIEDTTTTVTGGDLTSFLIREYETANLFMEQYYSIADILVDIGKEIDKQNYEVMEYNSHTFV